VANTLPTRLRQLAGEIKKLASKKDPSARLETSAKDPVSPVAKAINHLLTRSQARDARLLDAAELFQQTFWVLDPKGRDVTYLNGAGNLSSDPNAWATSAYPDDRDVVKAMLVKQREGDSGQAEFRMAAPDGGVRWLWCRYIALAGAGGSISKIVGVFEDVTEQKEAEQVLSASQTELRNVVEVRQSQKLQSIGELIGGIAHEINTPVQFVGDNVRFVREAYPKLDELLKAAADKDGGDSDLAFLREELPKALQQAQEGVERVAKIAKTLKEYSREQRDQGIKSANLNQAVESTLLIARNAMKYVADVETSYGVLPMVACHLGDIQQVLLDLFVHAAEVIEATGARSKKRGLIRVETKQSGEWVTISISDSGNPLSQEARERIFEPAANAEEEKAKGLSLAFAIVTEQHGGRLTVSSETGKGNTFSVRLPVLGKDHRASAAAAR
jgi:two-component system NtrC family sensor kinase